MDTITGKLPSRFNTDECVGGHWIIHHFNTVNVTVDKALDCLFLFFSEFTKKHYLLGAGETAQDVLTLNT